MAAMTTDLSSIAPALQEAGQSHLIDHAERLTGAIRDRFVASLAQYDWYELAGLVRSHVLSHTEEVIPLQLAPASVHELKDSGDRARYREMGEALISASKVAAFTVAGGQGTRLGFEGPKGCYPAGPVTKKPLFHIFAEGILATRRRYECAVPWYILTSPLNDVVTRAFFEEHRFFDLGRDNVHFIQQGTLPSFDMHTGRVLLSAPGELATNPDGHGGSITALHKSGALTQMQQQGIEHISYFQVDNPLVRVIDPVFVGLHAGADDSSAEMSSKAVAKSGPAEKVGVFCDVDGRTRVIEYSDLPEALSNETDGSGNLRYEAGSIALHVMGVSFLQRVATDPAFSLPFHRAVKKVPCIDPESFERVNPAEPNAIKLEKFVFDALPMCRSSAVVRTPREEEFAPIKNPTGADSVESSRLLQTARAARWLISVGVDVPTNASNEPDCVLELSPLTALDAEDLQGVSVTIEPGSSHAI
ncbi:MAG: UDPGP type 1 family protein [Phycisphaeraceae bacterium]|nr:UDPGP type 1 family protein [Phycisphaerales bacterium]MCB9859456.1 UDPGP type 1 family protein [Phycisphaeraceae bacterium]